MTEPAKTIRIVASNDSPGRVRAARDAGSSEEVLYEIRRKIYPRAVHGWFATWRWTLVALTQAIFYGMPWLTWNDRQAVLFDLVSRKFYIFGVVFWPQDVIYLALLLVISALSLFLFTAVGGRLFCGYACPQTVYTEIFMWIERKIEGDRLARMKLDQAPFTARKLGLKAAKHGVWIALALWTGFTFVGYFTPIRELASEVVALQTGPWETFWVLFYGFATYGNAGWMREQVCKYMCPYARFQSAMFDRDTMIVTYDAARGEPRGPRAKSVVPATKGLGDCVDCDICVQVCPTGIDIRKGLQYECIGCAACIDGCDQVMEKMGYAKGLIRYSTQNAIERKEQGGEVLRHAVRPRTLIYFALIGVIVVAAGVSLWMRKPLKVDVIRDRAALMREVEGGLAENVFRLTIMNTTELPQRYAISVEGLPRIALASNSEAYVDPASVAHVPVRVRADVRDQQKGSHSVFFTVQSMSDPALSVREKAVFIVK